MQKPLNAYEEFRCKSL